MATAGTQLLTAEEFGRLPNPPDGSQQELVRGEIITMPPPRGFHGACCLRVGAMIGNYVWAHNLGHVVSNDTGCVTTSDPDSVRGIDVAYWSFAKLPVIPEDEYIRVPPDLAVEVLSPSNERGEVDDKIEEYLALGVPLVWIVDPQRRKVTVYREPLEGKVLHEKATITGEDVLPGFSCPVADFFAGLPAKK